MSSTKTIVTACDPDFLLGFCLLLASLRCHGVGVPVHLVSYNLSGNEKKMLAALPGVTVFDPSDAQT
jgi:hypothetical protein